MEVINRRSSRLIFQVSWAMRSRV